jgi:hypothetical protein
MTTIAVKSPIFKISMSMMMTPVKPPTTTKGIFNIRPFLMIFELFIFKYHTMLVCMTSATLIREISTVATTLIIEISTTTTSISSSAITETIKSMAETRVLISGLLSMMVFLITTWSTSSCC